MSGIEAITSCENETEASVTKSVIDISDLQLPYITEKDIDKCHRVVPIDDDGKQNIIIKFTKHSTATKAFQEKRKPSKLISWKKHVKFGISLTR